jgi:competence protein ComEC
VNQIRLPLVAASLAFLAGLLCGLRFDGATGGTALAAVPLLLAPWLYPRLTGEPAPRWLPRAALWSAVAVAGAGHGALARADAAADCRAHLPDGAALTVRGALAANWVPPRDEDGKRPLLPTEVRELASAAGVLPGCTGGVRVRMPRGAPPALAGTEIVARGEWRTLPRPVLGSAWPRSGAFAGYLSVDSVQAVPPRWGAHPLLEARGRTQARLHRLMGKHGPLADALLLNRRETLDRDLSDRFAQTGLVHLLAISGTHVGLLGAVFVLLGRMLRLSRARVAWLTILLMAAYLALIGAPGSAVRSGIMMALLLIGGVLQRPSATLPIVSAAGLAILAADPLQALDAGFQLSFAGVLGILLLRAPMIGAIPSAWRRNPAARWLAESVVVSIAAFAFTAPVVAHHFGQVAPVSILANLPAIPLTSLALIGVGAAALLDPLVPPLARLVADGSGAALDLLNGVVDLAIRVPWGHASVARPRWWLWALAAIAFLLVMDATVRTRARVRWTAALMTAAAAFLLLPLAGAAAGSGMEIAFLDVGQGDAIAIRTPANRWVLVDAGERDGEWDAGERRVLPFLRARGASRLEAMVLTHPHADHIGGAAAVMRALPVARLLEPGMPYGSPMYLQTLETAQGRGVAWVAARHDRVLSIDGVTFTVLWPTEASLRAPEDANDISAVILLRYGAFSALLTGDAPSAVEEQLVARYGGALSVDVLKAGHHGSRTASSDALLEAARPALAVISCGVRNKYRHPHAEAMARLRAHGVPVARTDRDGTVLIEVDSDGRWSRGDP